MLRVEEDGIACNPHTYSWWFVVVLGFNDTLHAEDDTEVELDVLLWVGEVR